MADQSESSMSAETSGRRGRVDATLAAIPRQHRRPLLLGVIAGGIAALALGAYWVYDFAATPARPAVETSSLDEAVTFMIHQRGLQHLTRFEQERFLTAWKNHYMEDKRHRELRKYLEDAPEEKRQALRQVLFRVSKQAFLADAQQYLKIKDDATATYRFIAERLARFAVESAWLKGNGDPAKDLSGVLGTGLPRNPEDWTQWIVSQTTPEERVLGEQYLNAIRDVREQERKKNRSAGK